jgi:glycosyltransferase involved in cell wall biosynthesis
MFKFLSKNIILYAVLIFFNTSLLLSKICIIIPAYNEQERITNTLQHYYDFFSQSKQDVTLLVVANNCHDDTVQIVKNLQKEMPNLQLIDTPLGGKGRAIKIGYQAALKDPANYDLIGFVDADMATKPEHFYDLIKVAKQHDGAIASRYIKGANVYPNRPLWRKIGGKFYNWILRNRFRISYKDTQCGAKIFNRSTVQSIADHMTETGWAFDLELLYLCKLFEKDIVEVATTWSDQPGSHLSVSGKLITEFLNSPTRIKQQQFKLKKDLYQKKRILKKNKQLLKDKLRVSKKNKNL